MSNSRKPVGRGRGLSNRGTLLKNPGQSPSPVEQSLPEQEPFQPLQLSQNNKRLESPQPFQQQGSLPTSKWPQQSSGPTHQQGSLPPSKWPQQSSEPTHQQGSLPPSTWPQQSSGSTHQQGSLPTSKWPQQSSGPTHQQGSLPPSKWPQQSSGPTHQQGSLPPSTWPQQSSGSTHQQGSLPPSKWPQQSSGSTHQQGSLPPSKWPQQSSGPAHQHGSVQPNVSQSGQVSSLVRNEPFAHSDSQKSVWRQQQGTLQQSNWPQQSFSSQTQPKEASQHERDPQSSHILPTNIEHLTQQMEETKISRVGHSETSQGGRGNPRSGDNIFGRNTAGGRTGAFSAGNSNRGPSDVLPPSVKLQTIKNPCNDHSLPNRPDDGGTSGRKVTLTTNCVTLGIVNKPIPFFLYDIKFTNCGYVPTTIAPIPGKKTPDGRKREFKTRKERKAIFLKLQKDYSKELGQGLMYDGQAVIFGLCQIPDRVYVVEVNDDDHPDRLYKLEVAIKDTKSGGNLNELVDFVNPEKKPHQIPQEAIRMLNTFFHNAMTSGDGMMLSHGRTTVLNRTTQSLPSSIGVYCYTEGFNVSIRPHRWHTRLVIDKTQTAFHESSSLTDLILSFLQRNDHYNLKEMEIKSLSKHLRRLRVEADHFKTKEGKEYSRKFTINDIASKMTGDLVIPDLGKTVYQYMCETYPHVKSRITPYSPCIQYGMKKNWLPIELCKVVPYQAAPGKDARIVQDIIRKAAIPAFQRRSQIEEFLKKIIQNFNCQSSKYLMDNILNIDGNLVQTEARMLNRPRIHFGKDESETVEGEWRLEKRRFLKPATSVHKHPLLKWALIYTDQTPLKRNRNGVRDIIQAGLQLGMQVEATPKECHIYPREWQNKFNELICMKYDFAIIIIGNRDDYGALKRLGDQQFGIVTQVIRGQTWCQRMNCTTAINIWLKLNGKLGGVNWELFPSRPPGAVMREMLMVFGADVTHPSPGAQSGGQKIGFSIAAVVASVNPELTKFVAKVRQQATKLGKETNEYIEIILDMKTMVKALLLFSYQMNGGRKPDSILFYRDGVSEGQFRQVRNSEIKAIQDACLELEPSYMPGITFVIVQKRHNMRFFTEMNDKFDKQKGNVGPGTVVDTKVCHPREFDFYLNSHKAIQGTAKPAHYHVIWDDNNWGSDDLQNFTYLLCYGYMRCARSVSYPAPTYYAHLAAYRGRAWLGVSDNDSSDGDSIASSQANNDTSLHPNMEKGMFFL